MGTLMYGDSTQTEIDDRALAHLQIVMLNKLRRHESFAFSWKNPASEGDGRNTIWISPDSTLRFRYVGSRPPAINRAWISELVETAHSAAGLRLIPEPHEPSTA